MTRQMSRGSQVAFGKAWVERQGIEAQTVDVHAHIDSSLSYEENTKNLKKILGLGGRSKQKAARGLSAAECDVAIGNCAAGFVESCKDACKCGDPDACEVKVPRKKPKAKPKPKATTSSGIKKITNNMPAGYAIHKWSYIDRVGKVTVHAVLFKGKPVFDQNKTFESLTDARKAVKTHADAQRMLKQIKEEREHFAKHGNLGKTGYIEKEKVKPAGTGSATPLARPKQADYKPATTWKEFLKINKPQITKTTAAIKGQVANIADAKDRDRAFKTDIREYKIRITDIWSKTKAKATTKKKVTKTVKPQTSKRKKRSAQKTISGKTKPQKKPKKAKRCVRVKVRSHVRKCPTRRR